MLSAVLDEKLNGETQQSNKHCKQLRCGSGKFLRSKTTIVQRNLCRNNSEQNKITKKLKTLKLLV